MADVIHHLAIAADWDAATVVGEFRISSRDRTLEDEGFIHFSGSLEQLAGVAERYYSDVTEPMVLLTVDTARLPVPPVWEAPAPGVSELFPHLYGALPTSAVVAVTAMVRGSDGDLRPAQDPHS